MSQRNSEYLRQPRDLYETPSWVTEALLPHIPEYVSTIYEPAAGSGMMVRALEQSGCIIEAGDLREGRDFLEHQIGFREAIITNPPYSLAEQFIWHAIQLTNNHGFVAMLLRSDFDHAKSRQRLFNIAQFSKKIVLTKRIVWFERTDGKRAAPSENHAWFCWDWRHKGPPTIAYA